MTAIQAGVTVKVTRHHLNKPDATLVGLVVKTTPCCQASIRFEDGNVVRFTKAGFEILQRGETIPKFSTDFERI